MRSHEVVSLGYIRFQVTQVFCLQQVKARLYMEAVPAGDASRLTLLVAICNLKSPCFALQSGVFYLQL